MRIHLRRFYRLLRLALHMLLGMVIAHVFLVLWKRGRRTAALIRWWAYGVCRILNMQFSVQGEIHRAPALFVANHISWLDIVCLQAVLNATFVAKEEVRDWPLFGGMAVRAGTLFLRRGDASRTTQVAEQMAWNLAQKNSIVFFPEGTSTRGNDVDIFHARLFQAALHTRCPVQAVAISYPHDSGSHPRVPFIGDDNLLPHLWALLAESGFAVQLRFCPAVVAPANADRRSLARHARNQIAAVLAAGRLGARRLA